jgi:flagellar protein FlaJ
LHYALTLAFAGLSYYAYVTIPESETIGGRVVGVFLLSAGLGGVVAMLCSIAGRLSLFTRPSEAAVAFDLRWPVAIVSCSVAVTVYYVSHATGLAFLLFPIPALVVLAALSVRNIYPLRGRASIRPLTEDRLVKFVTSRERLKRLAERRAQYFATLLSKAGVIGNPYVMAAKSITTSLLAAAVAVPVALVLAVFVWRPLIFIACIPVLVYNYPRIRLDDRTKQRREGVEKELPFFLILVHVLGSAGRPLYEILTGTIDTKIFSAIKREALLVKRDVTVFGMDPVESFERLASYHPSRKLGTFLNGYTSKVRSGGDVPTYLTGESGSLLRELEEGWSRYSQRTGIIGSMMIMFFGVVPMMLLVVGLFSPATSVLDLTIFTGLGVPLFAILLVFMAGRMQPVGEDPLRGSPKRSIFLSLPGLAVGYLSGQVWLGLASALFVFCTVYGYSVIEQRREMREVDNALPEFMKDLMEYKRQEYDLTKAIINVAAHNRYTPTFDGVISRVAAQLKAGTPMNEVIADPKTRLARIVFFVLGQMAYSGGGTVDTYHQLSSYTTKVIEMKRSTMAEMRPYLYLAFFSPVLVAFGVTFIGGIIGSFGSTFGPSLHSAGLGIGVPSAQLKEVSNFLIVVSSASLGVISAKMIDFTVKNTLWASANVLVATLATFLLGQLNTVSLLHL